MFESHPTMGLQRVEVGGLPRRSPQQRLTELNEEHASRMQNRPPNLFEVPAAEVTSRLKRLHEVLTHEDPEL